MSTIKSRLAKLEQKHLAGDELVEAHGLGWFHGDKTDIQVMTKREFTERANRGLAGIYGYDDQPEAKAMAATDTNPTSKGISK